MEIKLKRNTSTGLAVRTTLKAGDDEQEYKACVFTCQDQDRERIYESREEKNRCYLTC